MQTLLLMFWSTIIWAVAPCKAWINTKNTDQAVVIAGHCRSLLAQPASYRYELSVLRRGAGGQSANSQQGRFELQPGQSVALSEIQLNLDDRTSFIGHLRILDATGQVVAQDSVRHTATRP